MAIRLPARYLKLIGAKVPSKYRSNVTEYKGAKYHSKKEADYAAGLDLLMRAGMIRAWTRQEKIPLTVNGIVVANYVMDFSVIHNDGATEYVEVKGFEKDLWKLKWKMLNAIYGGRLGYKITLVR
jgi:hypothetical protein